MVSSLPFMLNLESTFLVSVCMPPRVLVNHLVSVFISHESDFFWFFVGFGFLTSIAFIFLVGVFMSSWLGASVLNLGEWFIKRMPFVRHIYNASKQISTAISPGLLMKKTHFLHSHHYTLIWIFQSLILVHTMFFFWQIKIHKLSRKLQSSGIHV